MADIQPLGAAVRSSSGTTEARGAHGAHGTRLPRIGWLRVRGVEPSGSPDMALPDGADMKQVAVTQEPNGWHISIQFEAAPKVYATPPLDAVGIDGGLLALATLSDGSGLSIHASRARGAHGTPGPGASAG